MPNITDFITAANAQGTGRFKPEIARKYREKNEQRYNNLNLLIAFGRGRAELVPRIAFIKKGLKFDKGIYPAILYFKDARILFLVYCMYDKKEPWGNLRNDAKPTTIMTYLGDSGIGNLDHYRNSYVFTAYRTDQPLDEKMIQADLFNMTHLYKRKFICKIPYHWQIQDVSSVNNYQNSIYNSLRQFFICERN